MSEQKLAEVKSLPPNAGSIPTMLRSLANDIENGAVKPRWLVCIAEESPVDFPLRWLWGESVPSTQIAGTLLAIANRFVAVENLR